MNDIVEMMADDRDWMDSLTREREETQLEALMRCKQAGADVDDLETLATELGLARQWHQYEAATHN